MKDPLGAYSRELYGLLLLDKFVQILNFIGMSSVGVAIETRSLSFRALLIKR